MVYSSVAMTKIELGRNQNELSGKQKDRIATSLLSRIKDGFRAEVPPEAWKEKFKREFNRKGKHIELTHRDPDLEASTTMLRLGWADPSGKEHSALIEVVVERPILSIAGKPLWKLYDQSSFSYSIDGEIDGNNREAAEHLETLISFLSS